MRISLLIPCFNEAEGIPSLCRRLEQLLPVLSRSGDVEVIFVDDGSSDGTAEAIRKHAAGFSSRLLVHGRNMGIGAALKTGFAQSTGDQIVTLDSDCTYDPMEIPALLELLKEGYDIVTGSPYHPRGEVEGVPRWRIWLSKSLSRIYWIVLPRRLYTYTSCFRAYRREILPALEAGNDGFLCVAQLLVSGILHGARVAELPARLTRRKYGKSKIKIILVVLSHAGYLVQVISKRLSAGVRPGQLRARLLRSEGSKTIPGTSQVKTTV